MTASSLPAIALPGPDTPVAQAAAMYVAAELAPIPLYGITDAGRCSCGMADCQERNWGKHPIGRDWQKRASLDPEEVRDRFAHHRGNVGIYLALGGYVLLDADGAKGIEIATGWDLPPTLAARTGSGNGAHWIYRLAPHHDARAITDRRVAGDDDGHVDVKVRGQFVAAPSRHRSGGVYTWTSAIAPAVLPDVLYERIRRPVHVAPVPPPSTESPGDLRARAAAYLAKIPSAISGSGGHDQTFAAARALAGWVAKGLPDADAWALLCEYNARCEPPWSERELEHKWKSALSAHSVPALPDRPRRLHAVSGSAPPPADPPPPGGPTGGSEPDWRSELLWQESKSGNLKLVSHVENVIRILQLHPEWKGKIGFDEFASRVLVVDAPWDDYQKPTTAAETWTDEDGTRLSGWLRRKFHGYAFAPSITDCDRAVDVVARTHGFHPVRDYLESLEWDGTSRLGTWLHNFLGAEQTPYMDMVGRWWLISAVARIFRPGVMVRTVPILEGPQELKKSSAIKVLAGEQWVSDTPIDLGSKDAYQAIQGIWFGELAELDSLMRAGPSQAKAFFSSGIDRFRPPYGRRVVESPRQCIFVGTVNPPYEYLEDPSGGSRYWPIRCTRIDLDGLGDARDQLWAEAVAAYKEGQLWYPVSDGERAVLGEQQDDRERQDAWTERIDAYLRRTSIRRAGLLELLEQAMRLDPKDQTKAAQTRVGIIMTQHFGWLKVRRRNDSGRRFYEYLHPDEAPDEAQPEGPTEVQP